MLYSSGKSILETLIDLVQSMTIHPYLEDEIDVLIDLLAELARFHEVLHTLDLKACMNVWNFYSKFATDYFDHMKYDFFIYSRYYLHRRERRRMCYFLKPKVKRA